MQQQSFAAEDFERYRKPTRRERFLAEMDHVIPWKELCQVIEPWYPKPEAGKPGRRPIGIERMLRIHFLQHWFNLSDPGVEEALYDSRAMRLFVGIDLGREPVPDETTILKFRHLLEAHELGEQLFLLIGAYLEENGLKIGKGTIVDATIIQAPSSTKNRDKARDPDMKSTRKGKQWYFGMKLHIGVDSKTKLIHSLATTGANVHDSQKLGELLHGNETRVYGDSAYQGQHEVLARHAPDAKDFTNEKGQRNRPLSDAQKTKNKTKSKIRARVEHPFLVVKQVFGHTKVRYRGLKKNTNWLHVSCGLVNIYIARKHLLRVA